MTRDQRTSDDARPSTDDIAAASHTDRDDLTETETMAGRDGGATGTRNGESFRDSDLGGEDRTTERMTDSDVTGDLTDADPTGDLDRTEQHDLRGTGHAMEQDREVAADHEETRSGDWADSRGAAGSHRAGDFTDADTSDIAASRWGEPDVEPDGGDRTAESEWTDTRGDLAETDQDQVGDRTDAADLTGASEQSAPKASGDDELPAELFRPETVERFRDEWQRIQGRFVDDPQDAVRGADHLVAEVMQALATMFSEHKHELESQWQERSEAETEDLRLALRRYRSFFNQLLNA